MASGATCCTVIIRAFNLNGSSMKAKEGTANRLTILKNPTNANVDKA